MSIIKAKVDYSAIGPNDEYYTGKANGPDHNRPEQFDHLAPVLSACF